MLRKEGGGPLMGCSRPLVSGGYVFIGGNEVPPALKRTPERRQLAAESLAPAAVDPPSAGRSTAATRLALDVDGTELYHEVRGAGPPFLLIMGAPGDAGHFERLAELLADEFTIISYDRRGNGRSPRPSGWVATSAEEQADDAAALLEAVGLAPAIERFYRFVAGDAPICRFAASLRLPLSARTGSPVQVTAPGVNR